MSQKVSDQVLAEIDKYYAEDWHKPWLKPAKEQEPGLNSNPKSAALEAQKKFKAELAAAMSPNVELPDGVTLEGVLKDLAELKVKPTAPKAGPSGGKKGTKK